jgi:hypothetical protein
MDKSKLEKIYDSPGTVQTADLKAVPLEIIGALNVSKDIFTSKIKLKIKYYKKFIKCSNELVYCY